LYFIHALVSSGVYNSWMLVYPSDGFMSTNHNNRTIILKSKSPSC
jgi:hypothetical protein